MYYLILICFTLVYKNTVNSLNMYCTIQYNCFDNGCPATLSISFMGSDGLALRFTVFQKGKAQIDVFVLFSFCHGEMPLT